MAVTVNDASWIPTVCCQPLNIDIVMWKKNDGRTHNGLLKLLYILDATCKKIQEVLLSQKTCVSCNVTKCSLPVDAEMTNERCTLHTFQPLSCLSS